MLLDAEFEQQKVAGEQREDGTTLRPGRDAPSDALGQDEADYDLYLFYPSRAVHSLVPVHFDGHTEGIIHHDVSSCSAYRVCDAH